MTDEPIEPGRGLPVYQPATATEDGTCIAPPDASPSVIRLVFTPISGMVSETGLATGAGSDGCGGATMGPVGAGSAEAPAAAGRRTGVEWCDSSRAAVPPTMTTRPAAKAIAAGLRIGIVRPRCSADDAGRYGEGGNRRPGRPGRRPR